ncbi:MAG: pyridoxamine 5'-phosphate oxidase [Phenylobacterium zucineum]|nr:MAG: pyridoxamine 5'-phosphate oxidase [Phenylobacterium zucineum]
MTHPLLPDILEILRTGQDMTVATVRADGAPQATTVSYASDGLSIFLGCGHDSQKARNLAHDPRVSLTINLPYRDWSQIRGLSIFGRARPVTEGAPLARAATAFLAKFPEVAQYVSGEGEVAMFEITPELISVLDYRQGFGHHELVRVTDVAGVLEPAA